MGDVSRSVLFTALVIALLATVGFYTAHACNEAVCASIVSKCMLTQSCKCELRNCTCCKECFNCLDYLYAECCSCVGELSRRQVGPTVVGLSVNIFHVWLSFRNVSQAEQHCQRAQQEIARWGSDGTHSGSVYCPDWGPGRSPTLVDFHFPHRSGQHLLQGQTGQGNEVQDDQFRTGSDSAQGLDHCQLHGGLHEPVHVVEQMQSVVHLDGILELQVN